MVKAIKKVNLRSMDDVIKELKPAWKGRTGLPFSFYCPNCRSERKVRSHPNPSRIENYFKIGLVSSIFTLACWSWFGIKGLVSFVPFWVLFETVYRSRIRVALLCPHCGFDPFLYLRDVKEARASVEAHWKKVFEEKGIPYLSTGAAKTRDSVEATKP